MRTFSFYKFMIIFCGLCLVNSPAFAQSCIDLFKDDNSRPATVQTTEQHPERRGTETPLTYKPKTYSHSQVLTADYLPAKTQLTFSYENRQMRLFQETIVTVKVDGVETQKVKSEELPLDLHLPFVINASVSVGRRTYRACLENGHGIVIFIDVNDLGWVNNNFALKSLAGDQFISAVNRAIQQITHKKGLVFRLGGDELGILIPMMKPEELNIVLKILENKSKEFAQKIFTEEQNIRYAAFVKAKADYQQAKDNTAFFNSADVAYFSQKYHDALDRYVELGKYLEPSVSIGATYIGNGRSPDVIQADAEANSHPHKITIKQSTNKPVGKYSTDPAVVNYQPARLTYTLNYEFPLLTDMTGIVTHPRPQYNFNLPLVEWTREKQHQKRLGPYNISEFRPEPGAGKNVMKVEVWENGKVELVDLHTNDNTGFPDAQTVIAQKLLVELRKNKKYREIFVDLRNLGVLNYFVHLSKTGDQGLARVSQIINGFLGAEDIAFKLKGSEFAVFIEADRINGILLRLNQSLNSDPILRQIYLDQIQHMETTGADAEKIAAIRKLLDSPIVKMELR